METDAFNFLVDQLVAAAKQSGLSPNDTFQNGNCLFDIQAGDMHLVTNGEGFKEFNKQLTKKVNE